MPPSTSAAQAPHILLSANYRPATDPEGSVFEGVHDSMTVTTAASFIQHVAALSAVGVEVHIPGTTWAEWFGVALVSALEVTRNHDALRRVGRVIHWQTDHEQDSLLCDLLEMAHPGEVRFFARSGLGNIDEALDAYATDPRAAERVFGVQAALSALSEIRLRRVVSALEGGNDTLPLGVLVRMINAVCSTKAFVVDLDGNDVLE